MDPPVAEILIALYVATNGLRVFSYVPQIVRISGDSAGWSCLWCAKAVRRGEQAGNKRARAH